MGARGQPTVTVAIPVYNGADHLSEAILSVQNQTRSPTETIVFDNASTDDSVGIAGSLLGSQHVRTASVNQGAAWNFNRSASESSCEYFAWLAADDRLDPRFVEHTASALAAQPEADVCLAGFNFILPDGTPRGDEQRDPLLASPDPRVRLRSFLRRHRWTEVYCLYRRSRLLESPLFRDEPGADVTLTWWFLLRGSFVVLDELLVEYRVSPLKTLDDMSESLTPGAGRRRWQKFRIWRSLWRETRQPDLWPSVRRTARQELLLALVHRDWLVHNGADLLEAIPGRFSRAAHRRLRDGLRSRRVGA